MARNEKTSKRVASKASKILRSKKASKDAKSVAGSALTQAPDRKRREKCRYAMPIKNTPIINPPPKTRPKSGKPSSKSKK